MLHFSNLLLCNVRVCACIERGLNLVTTRLHSIAPNKLNILNECIDRKISTAKIIRQSNNTPLDHMHTHNKWLSNWSKFCITEREKKTITDDNLKFTFYKSAQKREQRQTSKLMTDITSFLVIADTWGHHSIGTC